mgnify:CR=1 FL=1
MKADPNDLVTVAVTEQSFEQEVLKSKEPVLVEFWTSWSTCCESFDTFLNDIMRTCGSRLKVARVNADDNPDLSLRYAVRHIPTLILFAGGIVRTRFVGTVSKEAILAQLEPFSAGSTDVAGRAQSERD